MHPSSQPPPRTDQAVDPAVDDDNWLLDLPVGQAVTFRDLAPFARDSYLRARIESGT